MQLIKQAMLPPFCSVLCDFHSLGCVMDQNGCWIHAVSFPTGVCWGGRGAGSKKEKEKDTCLRVIAFPLLESY